MHMGTRVVAVTINRGGQGKTMLCRSLGALAGQAGLAVLVADMDTQENSTTWHKRRPDERQLPLVEFTTEKQLPDLIERARTAECDLVLIDTPPGRSTEAAAAVEECDLALVPCNDEIESFEGLPRTARLARTTGKRAIVVPNWVTPGSQTAERTIRGIAESHGLPSAPVALHRYTVHKEASLLGLTACELEPHSKAAAELHALWDWLRAELHTIESAQVHKVA
jgi:chromosome partitioning protein